MFDILKKRKLRHKRAAAGAFEGDQRRLAGSAARDETPGYRMIVSLRTDPGCVRQTNEDSCIYFQPEEADVLKHKGSLLIVADGMGGHAGGEIASRMATEIVHRAYYQDEHLPLFALTASLRQANRRIYETALGDEALSGMGTTCTALVLQNGSAICAHVGDSRLYLARGHQLYLITEDHSQVREMFKQGLISAEEARYHPDKNVIFRALGSHAEVEIPTWEESVREGDRFILCSDGLHDLVENHEIEKAMITHEPHIACKMLVDLAKERGGHDNITVAIVWLEPVVQEEPKRVRLTRDAEVMA